MFSIAEEGLEAFHDIWIAGDEFVRETQAELYALRRKAILKNSPLPYIFAHFNVRAFYTNTGLRTDINKLIDPLVEVLNTYHRLPKYLVVVPDVDLLKCMSWESGISIMLSAALHYIVKQYDIFLRRRNTALMERRHGAVMPDQYPKIIWVRMPKRPHPNNKGIFSLSRKFNSILEERLLDDNAENHYIMSIDVHPQHFDASGSLSISGMGAFWKEVNTAIKRFDHDEISLRPRQYKANTAESNQVARKLPTPPPVSKKETKRTHHTGHSSSPGYHRAPKRKHSHQSHSHSQLNHLEHHSRHSRSRLRSIGASASRHHKDDTRHRSRHHHC